MRNKKSKRMLFAILIGFAVVSFWRGLWGLMDLYLFPANKTLSFSVSILIGIIILLFTNKLIKELMYLVIKCSFNY